VKQKSVLWAALTLFAPLALVLILIVFPIGCGGGKGNPTPTPTPAMGLAEIGFTDSPSANFQKILLNVFQIRLNPNPQLDQNISDLDPNWVVIPAPAGLGSAGEVQIDLNTVQNDAKLFNTASIPAQTYHSIEVLVDQNTPGQIVPSCPKLSAPEGCIAYPVAFTGSFRLFSSSGIVVTPVTPGGGVTPILIDIVPMSLTPPNSVGGFYTMFQQMSLPSPNLLLTQVSGNVNLGGVSSNGVSVTAEIAGTNSVIANAPVDSTGNYHLQLPAAPPPGTFYDLFAGGGAASFNAVSTIPVVRLGAAVTQGFTVANDSSTGGISGTITDKTTGAPVSGATVEALFGQASGPNPVVVRSTATDQQGNYALTFVPFGTYTIRIIASGYDTANATAPVSTASAAAICAGSTNPANCSFALTSNTIQGTVTIDNPPPPGTDVEVLVVAEDSGTTNMENVTRVIIRGGMQAPFTLKVPTSITTFDLIASAQDLFEGMQDPFTGHTIAVAAGVAGNASNVSLGPLGCVGHGSVSGTVANPDYGTQIVLSKSNVRIMQSTVGRSGGPNAGQFSFCAPPDTYTVQKFEQPAPNAALTPSSAPTTVAVPVPAATNTPCPSTCQFPSGQCPGPCVAAGSVSF
jgi:hypothetical protein